MQDRLGALLFPVLILATLGAETVRFGVWPILTHGKVRQ